MIVLIDAAKTLDKIKSPFIIITLSALGFKGNFLKMTKGNYE